MKKFISYAKTFKTFEDFLAKCDPCFEDLNNTEVSYYFHPDNSGRRERVYIKGFKHNSFRKFFNEISKQDQIKLCKNCEFYFYDYFKEYNKECGFCNKISQPIEDNESACNLYQTRQY